MMLRSSSTPLLNSLIPSLTDSSTTELLLHTPSPVHGQIWHSRSGGAHASHRPFRSPSVIETHGGCGGFRRVQSEGNLDQLADASYAGKHGRGALEAIPSIPNEEEEAQDWFQRPITSASVGETGLKNENDSSDVEGRMYLAMGLGAGSFVDDGGSGGRSGGRNHWKFNQESDDDKSNDLEDHYRRLLEEDPKNPLALQNYASFLHQVKGDLRRAEEYSLRATLANPEDGDALSQYAKLTWALHHDQEKANRYFEKSVRASPEDSHLHAAYASFLWNVS